MRLTAVQIYPPGTVFFARVQLLEELAFFRGIIVLAHLPGRLASVLAVVDHLDRDVAEPLVL